MSQKSRTRNSSALPRMNGVNPEPAKTLRYGIEWTKQSKKTAEVDK